MRRTLLRIWPLALVVGALGFCALALTLSVVLVDSYGGRGALRAVKRIGLANIGVGLGDEGRPVTFQSRGLRLVGGLYGPAGSTPYPAVVVVHGMIERARKLALYVLLARELADRCYVVLLFDLPGFGDSEDPRLIDDVDAWDARRDVQAATDYLRSLPFVDPDEVHLIGHSMGGSYALGAAALDRKIKTVVALGPGRLMHGRIIAPGAPARLAYYRRFFQTRRLEGTLPMDTSLKIASLWDLEMYRDAYSRTTHQPVLLIDGALEGEDDRAALQRFHATISEPKRYVTIPNVGHYNNVSDVRGLVFHDREAFKMLIEEIDRWLTDPIGRKC